MRRTLGISAVLMLIAVSANSSSPQPEPGLYRVTVGVSGQDLGPGMVKESAEQCLTEEDLAADPASFLGEQSGMEGCRITSHSWSNGKISMQMECSVQGMEATAESSGTYNASGYELITIMNMKIGETQIEMTSTVSGERIGDC